MAGANNQFSEFQMQVYSTLAQLLPNLTHQQLLTLLQSIDSDLTVPLRVDQNFPASLIVNVQPAIISNSVSNRNRSINFIGNDIPVFTGGTVTFPSSSGGNVTTSTGGSAILTCPAGNYAQVLLSMDTTGDLLVTVGGYSPTEAGATVPAAPSGQLAIAYVTVQNIGGTIQNITQNNIYQLVGGGGTSSGGSSTGFAQSVSLSSGETDVIVTFPSSLSGVGYVVNCMMANTTDAHPQFQPVDITNKTVNGFTASWDQPLDTNNYFLYYIVPAIQSQIAQVPISNGVSTVSVTLPIAMASTSYVVTANIVNLTDANPQFLTPIVVSKSITGFTASWTNVTDTSNYLLAYNAAIYQ